MSRKPLMELERLLEDRRIGIPGEAAKAIRRLFRHVLLGEELSKEEREKWIRLGWLKYEDGKPKLLLGSDNLAAEICLMALTWEGYVEKITPRKRRQRKSGDF